MLVLLIVLLPGFDRSKVGQQWFSIVNLLVLVTSLVAVGRSRYTLLVAMLLVAPALLLLWLSETTGDAGYRVWSWRFSIAVLVATLVPLLRYVLGPEVMTIDKVFGGAASYLLLGLLWCYFYALAEHRLAWVPRRPAERIDARRRHGLLQLRDTHHGWSG